MPAPLAFLSRAAAAVLDELTDGLGVGQSRKIDRSTAFMAVHLECLQSTPVGLLFSVAHYYESNGDLCCDPDVTLVRTADGWSPVSFQNSIAYRVAVRFGADGTVEVDEREQRELISFVGTWMANIREQQGLAGR
jgi:hypothetical protein